MALAKIRKSFLGMGKQFDLVCGYAMITQVDEVMVVAAFDVDHSQTNSIKVGNLIVRSTIKDQTGDWVASGSMVLTEIQEGAIGSGHRIYKFTCSEKLDITEKLTYRNYHDRNHVDVQYLMAAQKIFCEGAHSGNRTATPTTKCFGHMMKFDVREGHPLLTSKFLNPRNIYDELGWFCRGETNINGLQSKIWNKWATPDGELGPVYGAQWRAWEDLRIVNGGDETMLDFINSQDYELKATFDNSDRMDENLRAKVEAGEVTVDQVAEALCKNGVTAKVYTTESIKGYSSDPDSTWIYYGNFVLVILEYSANVENYYRTLNDLGVEGDWTESNYVFSKKFDQLKAIVDSLKNNPDDRRMLVTAFNPGYTPVTNVPYSNQRDRKEDYLNVEIKKVMSDENWMAEAERRMDSGGEAPIMQARDYCEGQLHNGGPSDLDSDGMSEEEHLEALLDYAGAPKTRYFTPKENAAVGQQALPPCHMMFQLGTSPMSPSDRIEAWRTREIDNMLQDGELVAKMDSGEASWSNTVLCAKYYEELNDRLSAQYSSMDSHGERTEKITAFMDSENVPTHFLDMTMYQRSADWFLGVPYNIASYSALLSVFGAVANMESRNFFHMFGDYHIYDNHREQLQIQMQQEIKPMPRLRIKPIENISDLTADHFELIGYEPGIKLKGEAAE